MYSEITLEINGYRRDILRYNYRFSRNTDLKGRPTTGVLDGSIYIEMESDGDSSILDMMLVDMNKPRPSFFFRAEPTVVSGRIRHTKDEMMLRELVFDEAYISCYGETMNATGSSPMITHFLISPTRLDINRTIRLDRRIKTTYGFWWEEYKEEEKKPIIPVVVSEPSKPIVLVTSVKGKATALPNAIVEYKVTGYNIPNISSSDKTRIKWMIKVEGQEFSQKTQGETLKLTIDEAWAGKEIVVMPYLKKCTPEVSAKTLIKKQVIVFFIGGAGDKRPFSGFGPTHLMKSAMEYFKTGVNNINKIDCKCVYLGYYELYPKSDIDKYVMKEISNNKIPIYIIGHSLGGWNGAHLSRILSQKGYKVEMLITLDPVNGNTGLEYFSDLYHDVPLPVGAGFWINIKTEPDLRDIDISDVIARAGNKWDPWVGKPNINYVTKKSHAEARSMFIEKIKEGKSANELLLKSILK